MPPDNPGQLRIGVDIGGTFTDLVVHTPDGRLMKRKLSSTPDDYARAIVDGIVAAVGDVVVDIDEIVHATTVATNAILERQGARTALITTEGFRDVLELRRIRIPLSYDLGWEKPPPLVDRALRFEVRERLDHLGSALTDLDTEGLNAVVDAVADADVEAIAVSLIHAYRNAGHERQIAEALRARLPDCPVSLSSAVLPEIQEFERTSTTVVNAYVQPLIAHYLGTLRDRLRAREVTAPILVMQSNGGLVPAGTAAERPVTIIESGPAAGVVAATKVAAACGLENVITLDMGGTTTKASIIENGGILRARDYEVGGSISVSSRLIRGGGYMLRIPVIDISEVGAGGGSIAALDRAGALRVGPRSAGASPGPACYGLGNDQPTVTDANLVLGYLHDGSLAGGALEVDKRLAERAVQDHLATPAGLSTLDAAHGVHEIVNSNMVRAIKTVSVERGRDPAHFALMAFGGAGPIHAAGIAETLNIQRIVVPPAPGLFSAFGLLHADVEHHATQTVLTETAGANLDALRDIVAEMSTTLKDKIRAEGFADEAVSLSLFADMRYAGQSSELMVPLPTADLDPETVAAAEAAFEEEFERLYQHRGAQKKFELVNLHAIATVQRDILHEGTWEAASAASGPNAYRPVYFGPEIGSLVTRLVRRDALSQIATPGPLIVEEYDSTVVVPPAWQASLDARDNIILERIP
jgi:N-methylhydantoinase A